MLLTVCASLQVLINTAILSKKSYATLVSIVFISHFVTLAINLYLIEMQDKMSRIVRKRDYCLCENKGADQLRSNCEADQRLCFRYLDSTIPLLLKSEISSF